MDMSVCDCVVNCTNECAYAVKNGGEIPFDNASFLVRGKPIIFECGVDCGCLITYRNRVCQGGVRKKLQVFRTKDNIWGVRCQYVILADEFVCEFANEFVSDEFIGIGLAQQPNMVYSDQLPRRWEE